MGAAFAPNHKGMPLVAKEAKLDFFSRQVLTSRNIRGSWLKDNLMGGLNYQVEHHLFPSMARPNLRKAHEITVGLNGFDNLQRIEVAGNLYTSFFCEYYSVSLSFDINYNTGAKFRVAYARADAEVSFVHCDIFVFPQM
jgi:hypothetical protein